MSVTRIEGGTWRCPRCSERYSYFPTEWGDRGYCDCVLKRPAPPKPIPPGRDLWNYSWWARHKAVRAYKKSIQPERH